MKTQFPLLIILTAILFNHCNNSDEGKSITASGTLEAKTIVVSSKIAGQILTLKVDEGSQVKIGDTLMLIDNEVYSLQLAQAEAAFDMAEDQLSLLQKGSRKEDVEQANAVLNQAKINYDAAEKDFNRIKKLFDDEAVSQKQFDDTKNRLEISKAQLKAADENLTKLKNIIRPEELKQAEAKLKQAKASRDLIQKNISECVITSPTNGFITKKYFEEGEVVSPMGSLFQITDLAEVDLVIYVSESELPKITTGQKAEITIDAFSEKKYEGRIIYISPEAEFTPKNIQTKDERTKLVFAVKIKIKNETMELKSGLPADAKIILLSN